MKRLPHARIQKLVKGLDDVLPEMLTFLDSLLSRLPTGWLAPQSTSSCQSGWLIFKPVWLAYGAWNMLCAMVSTSSAKLLWKLNSGWPYGLKPTRLSSTAEQLLSLLEDTFAPAALPKPSTASCVLLIAVANVPIWSAVNCF